MVTQIWCWERPSLEESSQCSLGRKEGGVRGPYRKVFEKLLEEDWRNFCNIFHFLLEMIKRKGFDMSHDVYCELRRPYKSLCPQWCILCKRNGESINHLFLHCPVTIGLWHKLFNLAGLAWVPPRSIEDMLVVAFKGLGNSLRGKTLWQITCLTLLWMVWQERNNRIFEDKGRTEEMLWDLILFFSSLWASCTAAFRGVPLKCFTTQLDCDLRFKSLKVLGFFYVFSFL